MTLLIRRSFLRLAVALGVTMALPVSASLPAERVGLEAARAVLLICNTQNRSRAVWQALRERGYTNVRYVEGGMSEWARRGLPLVMPAAR